MANPRRSSLQLHHGDANPPILPLSSFSDHSPPHQPSSLALLISSLLSFLKRPQAFPILLSVFVLLTWLSLRFQHPHPHPSSSSSPSLGLSRKRGIVDRDSNSVRFRGDDFPSRIARDRRGWLLDPVSAARDAGIQGAQSCVSVHVGEIKPGGVRGNHRHHTCNETFIIWGAVTKFRLENAHIENKAYAEVTVGEDEVAIAASPSGTAHALINVDRERTTFFLGCQDNVIDYNASTTDFKVWEDI
ncbi:hypothetical protein J5N97_003605 [Dioscorea zingiberensis]|uniref:Capsular polysaccharide assembling protein CapF C-terminal domain-containing protein n=1 Tax=Dioscorea zingiberensis TaxID=325984 RepID=A0A9D5HQK9_9LILI|nr:hypothetical protein J5N97_003605 [Dioscorea zingiberensis]